MELLPLQFLQIKSLSETYPENIYGNQLQLDTSRESNKENIVQQPKPFHK